MISLKKLIETNQEEWVRVTLGAYRAALEAMGNSGVQACPALGTQLQAGLWALQRQLEEEATLTRVQATQEQVKTELFQWGEQSADYYRRKTEEIKEILMIMARTAEGTGDRDQRHSAQLTEFTARLHSLASMDDLAGIRESLVTSANELQSRVEQMAEEGKQAITQLRGELRQYQTRLEEAERLASIDMLTGLQNRRRMEAVLERRLAKRREFSVLLLDLNDFKGINDTCGHAAGDDILRQFAIELGAAFRATDDVGRWGGDEFIVVVDCGLEEARRHAGRIQQWAFGDYTVGGGAAPRKLAVTGSIGAAVWKEGDTQATLVERADADMYQGKKAKR